MTRVYKQNNKITITFNMVRQNAILTAAKLNRTYEIHFKGNWNNTERCAV